MDLLVVVVVFVLDNGDGVAAIVELFTLSYWLIWRLCWGGALSAGVGGCCCSVAVCVLLRRALIRTNPSSSGTGGGLCFLSLVEPTRRKNGTTGGETVSCWLN